MFSKSSGNPPLVNASLDFRLPDCVVIDVKEHNCDTVWKAGIQKFMPEFIEKLREILCRIKTQYIQPGGYPLIFNSFIFISFF